MEGKRDVNMRRVYTWKGETNGMMGNSMLALITFLFYTINMQEGIHS